MTTADTDRFKRKKYKNRVKQIEIALIRYLLAQNRDSGGGAQNGWRYLKMGSPLPCRAQKMFWGKQVVHVR